MNSATQTPVDFEHFIEALGDAIVIADPSGAITVWNPAAERLFGFTQAEALGNSLDLIIPERLRERHWAGYLFVTGRLKEIINRGGEKISPGDVDAALLSNAKVLEAASFGESDAIYGENVNAAVILRPGMEATEGELRDYCRTRLSAFEVPQRIYIVAGFPRTAKGSTDRRALALQFAAR